MPVAKLVQDAGRCGGCGVVLAPITGPVHPYFDATPACWAMYTEQVLPLDYENPERMRHRQLAVDAYAAQHPGSPLPSGDRDRRAVQSVAIHLMTLCLFLEHGVDPEWGSKLHASMTQRPVFHELVPPDSTTQWLTVRDIVEAGGTPDAILNWARSVWKAWTPWHAEVHRWLDHAGMLPTREHWSRPPRPND